MSSRKQRVTVSVDQELFEAGQHAVETGQADSVSSWVSSALEEKIRRDRKLVLLGAAVADFERAFGEITAEEMAAQRRDDAAGATIVRGQQPSATRKVKSA